MGKEVELRGYMAKEGFLQARDGGEEFNGGIIYETLNVLVITMRQLV